MKVLDYIKAFIVRRIAIRRRRAVTEMFNRYFKKIKAANPNMVSKYPIPDEWREKWTFSNDKPLAICWDVYSSFFDKPDSNIVPNNIARNYIEPILTPAEYQPFYNDKNSFGVIIPADVMPKTYLRSVKGILYDGEYNPVSKENFNALFLEAERLIVKPSKDMGGHGVTLFAKRDDGGFYDKEGNKFSLELLLAEYKQDFLVQECLKQSAYMSQFNPTSVNTIRIASYRDVHTGEIHILGAVLRIGGKGAFVDNACSGGSFVEVKEDGSLGKYVCTQYGQTNEIHNGINFATSTFIIPEYDKIKEFVKNIAKRLPHMSLFANDVAIDENGNPKLIEINTTDFSYWLYQFNGKAAFGEYTNDLLEFCKGKLDRV